MRYSEIVGPLFYNIGLTAEQADMVDVHFSGAAHHFLMLPFCKSDSQHAFHLRRHRAHLHAMMTVIFDCGNFKDARDESLRGLDRRENWDPQMHTDLPDPRMFGSIQLDMSFSAGEALPIDFYLPLQLGVPTWPVRLVS